MKKTVSGKRGTPGKRAWAVLAAAVAVFCLCARAPALTPPLPGMVEQYRRDGTLEQRIEFAKKLKNDEMAPDLVAGVKYRMAKALGQPVPEMLPPSGRKGLPTGGAPNVLVLLIEFNEYPHSNEATEINVELFGDGEPSEYPYESLKNYYLRSSFNKLEIRGTVKGWRNAGNRGSVDQTDSGREDLIVAALRQYDSVVNYSIFDNDVDGEIDYFIVIWTGPHNGWSNFWWAYKTNFGGSEKFDGVSLGAYSWNPEYMYQPPSSPGDFQPRVIIHETGHALGLPDYYDYDDTQGPDGGVGNLDMMDANWGDHNAFSKYVLGWLEPDFFIVNGTWSLTVKDSDTSSNQAAYAIMPGAPQEPFTEYFIVENRNHIGNDSDHPGAGMLIWHVDAELNWLESDFKYDNSYTDHKLLRLMEADGLEEIENNSGGADYFDYYFNGKPFTPYTTPNSNKYDGTNTQINIANTSAPGAAMTFDLRIGSVTNPPVKSNFNPAEGATVSAFPEITFNTSLNAKCRWSLSDLSYAGMANDCGGSGSKNQSCRPTGLTGGQANIYIACSDMFNVADSAAQNEELTYSVDDNFPTQSNWSPPSGATITTTPMHLFFDVSRNATCTWSFQDLSFDDMPADDLHLCGRNTTSQYCVVRDIRDGPVTVYTACCDEYHNSDSEETNVHLLYTFDSLPPEQSGWNPPDGSTVTTASPILTLSTNENATCRWGLDDERYSNMNPLNTCQGGGTTNHTCSLSLSEGTPSFHVSCTDATGHEQTLNVNTDLSYIVDTLPPGQAAWNPPKGASLDSSVPVITFQTGENSWCRWSLSDLSYGDMPDACVGGGTKSHSCGAGGLQDGPEIVYTACADSLGNEDSPESNEHINYTISTTTPEPYGIEPSVETTLNSESREIAFSTNKNSSCRWALDEDLAYGDMTHDCSGAGTTFHVCLVEGFVQGLNIVYISCDDGLGHVDDAESNMEIGFEVDMIPPLQSNWFPARGAIFASSSILLSFDTDEEASCRTSLEDLSFQEMSDAANCNSSYTTSHECNVSGLATGPEIVYISCARKDDSWLQNSSEDNEEINYFVDQSAPAQSNWDPRDGATLTATSAVLSFNTDETAACKWSPDDLSYDDMSFLCDGFGSISHSCNLKDLATGPVYIHVSCSDYLFNANSPDDNTDIGYTVLIQEPVQPDANPSVHFGWNLLGGSRSGAALDAESVFGADFYAVMDYEDGEISWGAASAAITLDLGGGLWLYSEKDAGEADAGGAEYTGPPFEIAGGPGWKIFSNPYADEIAWSAANITLSCTPAADGLPDVFYYSNEDEGYVRVLPDTGESLWPWRGYWIYFTGNCTLTLPK